MNKKDEQYLHCPEFRVVRYQKGQSPYLGLYADGFSICSIFHFQSRDGSRQSFMHANRFTKIETVLKEAAWVGDGGRCVVYSKHKPTISPVTGKQMMVGIDFIDELQQKITCHFEIKRVEDQVNALLCKVDGEVIFFDSVDHGLNVAYHPNFSQLECFYKLNESFAYGALLALKQQPLVYDGLEWQSLFDHDFALHPVSRKLLELMDVKPEDHFRDIILKIQRFAQRCLAGKQTYYATDVCFIGLATRINCIMQVAPFVQLYTLGNDTEKQFVMNINSELDYAQAMFGIDEALCNALKRVLTEACPVDAVCKILKNGQEVTEFGRVPQEIAIAFKQHYFHYQRATLGAWVEPSSYGIAKKHC